MYGWFDLNHFSWAGSGQKQLTSNQMVNHFSWAGSGQKPLTSNQMVIQQRRSLA